MYELGVVYRNIQRADAAVADKLAALGSATVHESMGRVGLMKPERAMFDHARDALALDLEHALFIDDHPGNIEAARAFGWQALRFENAAQCEAALRHDGWL